MGNAAVIFGIARRTESDLKHKLTHKKPQDNHIRHQNVSDVSEDARSCRLLLGSGMKIFLYNVFQSSETFGNEIYKIWG